MSDRYNLQQPSSSSVQDADTTPPVLIDEKKERAERRDSLVERLEAEKAELRQKIADLLPDETTRDAAQAQEQIIAQLRDEIQILYTRLEDESTKSSATKPAKDVNVEELERRVRELKDKNRQLILDKQDLQKEAEDHSDRLAQLQSSQVTIFSIYAEAA